MYGSKYFLTIYQSLIFFINNKLDSSVWLAEVRNLHSFICLLSFLQSDSSCQIDSRNMKISTLIRITIATALLFIIYLSINLFSTLFQKRMLTGRVYLRIVFSHLICITSCIYLYSNSTKLYL